MVSECLSPPSEINLDAQFPSWTIFSSFLPLGMNVVPFFQMILLYAHYQQGVCWSQSVVEFFLIFMYQTHQMLVWTRTSCVRSVIGFHLKVENAQLSPPYKPPFCFRGGGNDSHVCNRQNENTLWWYVKIKGGRQVADSGKMFTSNWPCGKWEKQEGDPILSSFLQLLSSSTDQWAPWMQRWCWSLAAPLESASAWLCAWLPTPRRRLKVTRTCVVCWSQWKAAVPSNCWSLLSSAPSFLGLFFLVYATMRNLSKKERLLESVKGLHKDTLDILQMDVTSQQSILEATARIVEKRIDILGMLSNSWRKVELV